LEQLPSGDVTGVMSYHIDTISEIMEHLQHTFWFIQLFSNRAAMKILF